MLVQKIHLPEIESLWKWPQLVNLYLREVEEESYKWSASFGAFTPEVHALVHDKGKLSTLVPNLSASIDDG